MPTAARATARAHMDRWYWPGLAAGRRPATGTGVTDATTSYGHGGDGSVWWSAVGAVTGTCSSPPAGATTYSYDNTGNLTSTSNGLSASYNLQNQNTQLTPPGGQPFDMSYVGASSDRRTQAGALRISYDQLGLNTQGTAPRTPTGSSATPAAPSSPAATATATTPTPATCSTCSTAPARS